MRREKLIRVRKKQGLSRADVATVLGIAEITVRSIENGKRDPGNKLATKFAYLFQMRVEQLFPDIFLPDNDTKRIIKVNLNDIKQEELTQ